MGIESWSTTAADNDAAPPDGWPEGQTPSSLNNCGRQVQASVRTWYEDAEWVNLGHTPTRTGNTTFTVDGDKTADYVVGRRIKCTDSSTIYGTIVSSSYSSPDTTVTIHSDSGNLSASLSAVALSTQKPSDTSIHANLGRKGSDIASATTTDLSTATGDFVDVTGTTTITALGTLAAGVERTVRFTGALTLTHHATSLILPGGANITTANGDVAVFKSLGSGNWICINYTAAAGQTIPDDSNAIVKGSADATKQLRLEVDGLTTATTRVWTIPDTDVGNVVVQRVNTQTGAVATGTGIIPNDDTPPQNTEGDLYLQQVITPKNANNILMIDIFVMVTNSASPNTITAALFQDSTANALAAQAQANSNAGYVQSIAFRHTMSAGTTSATTFKLRIGGGAAGTTTFNGSSGTRLFGGICASSITVTEYGN